MKWKRLKLEAVEKPLLIWDYVIFLGLALICFLFFQQRDLMHTVGCSIGYLDGHVLDFYDYDGLFEMHPAYMPTIYLIFAIWNIPMKLFGFLAEPTEAITVIATMWSKLLPCSLYLASGFVIYKICMEIGMGSKKSKLCTYACLTMPVSIYAQFIFGQYDIFMTFCSLMGLYYYLKGKDKAFILWFAVAFTFKFTALLIFLPLLFLRVKNIWKIIGSCALSAVPFAVEYLIYRGSKGFAEYAFGFGGSGGDSPTGYIFNATIFTGFELSANQYGVSLVVLIFGMACALAYFTKPVDKKEWVKWTFFICNIVFFAVFGLAKWHPQWLLFAVPFWVISAFLTKNTKIFLILDILFMLFYIIFNVSMVPGNVDQGMFNLGILKHVVGGDIGTETTMAQLMGVVDPTICISMITLLMLVYAVFKHPKYCLIDFRASVDDCMGWMRTRLIAGTAIFLVPAFICLYAYLTPPNPTYRVDETSSMVLLNSPDVVVSQKFEASGSSLEKIQFPIAVHNRVNDCRLTVEVTQAGDAEILFSETRSASSWYDNEIISIKTGGIPLEKGELYQITFYSEDATADSMLALRYCEENRTGNTSETSLVNGAKESWQFDMTLYEK